MHKLFLNRQRVSKSPIDLGVQLIWSIYSVGTQLSEITTHLVVGEGIQC